MISLSERCGLGADGERSMRFAPGDLVLHRRHGYRGVVVACDERFCGSEEQQRQDEAPASKDQPWYHVLVHGGAETYVPQAGLVEDPSAEAVDHPLVPAFFSGFADGKYVRNGVAFEG